MVNDQARFRTDDSSICKLCLQETEDQAHFIARCPRLEAVHSQLLTAPSPLQSQRHNQYQRIIPVGTLVLNTCASYSQTSASFVSVCNDRKACTTILLNAPCSFEITTQGRILHYIVLPWLEKFFYLKNEDLLPSCPHRND